MKKVPFMDLSYPRLPMYTLFPYIKPDSANFGRFGRFRQIRQIRQWRDALPAGRRYSNDEKRRETQNAVIRRSSVRVGGKAREGGLGGHTPSQPCQPALFHMLRRFR